MLTSLREDCKRLAYQWEYSDDCHPSPRVERIRAALVVINSVDTEGNP